MPELGTYTNACGEVREVIHITKPSGLITWRWTDLDDETTSTPEQWRRWMRGEMSDKLDDIGTGCRKGGVNNPPPDDAVVPPPPPSQLREGLAVKGDRNDPPTSPRPTARPAAEPPPQRKPKADDAYTGENAEPGLYCGKCRATLHLPANPLCIARPGEYVQCRACGATCTKLKDGWGPWELAKNRIRFTATEQLMDSAAPVYGVPVVGDEPDDLREQLAAVQHDIWAHWMKYLFSCCDPLYKKMPKAVIPIDKFNRWKRQMETPYSELSEAERESDREQADKVLVALGLRTESRMAALEQRQAEHDHHIARLVQSTDLPIKIVCPDEESALKKLGSIRRILEEEAAQRTLEQRMTAQADAHLANIRAAYEMAGRDLGPEEERIYREAFEYLAGFALHTHSPAAPPIDQPDPEETP